MPKLLVTGGAGFIGTNFVRYWCAHHPGDAIVVLDALTYAGNRANLGDLIEAGRITFVEGDICDAALVERVLIEHELDTIVHFAAESHVDRSITGPAAFVRTNVMGTESLLSAAREVWLGRGESRQHRFHHISTDEVFGALGPNDPAFTETTPYAPNSPYAASKAAADHMVRAYHRTYGLQVTTTNCSNNLGPYQFPEKLIPLCLINALTGKPLPVYGDGRQIRDWLHVEDHCRGIELVLRSGKVGETYNIGANCEWANLDLVRTLCDALDRAFSADPMLSARFLDAPPSRKAATRELITFVTDRPGHDRRYAVDSAKIRRELGFRDTIRQAEALEQTIRWYLEHESWWRETLASQPR
jgi:dTDP-glucose 4,6-dehydratase